MILSTIFLQDKKCKRFFGSRIRQSDHDAFQSVAPWPNIRYHKLRHPTSDQVDSGHTHLRSFRGFIGFLSKSMASQVVEDLEFDTRELCGWLHVLPLAKTSL